MRFSFTVALLASHSGNPSAYRYEAREPSAVFPTAMGVVSAAPETEGAGAARHALAQAKSFGASEEKDARFKAACAADGGNLWTEYQKLHQTEKRRVLVYNCEWHGTCGGVGNQLRGIAVAFYIAMVTKRAFYIQWRQPEVAHNKIDWQLPNGTLPDECTDAANLGGGIGCTWRNRCEESKSLLLHESASCLLMLTNAVPSIWWEFMAKGPDSDLLAPVQQAVAQPEFVMGCALNFLFDFSGMERALAQSRTLRLGSSIAPSSFVALHMRWGDEHLPASSSFVQDDEEDELGPAEKERTRAALLCAHSLGKDLFTEGQPWSIFFASDSPGARRYVSEAASELNVSVCENEWSPVHGDHASAADEWNVWGDFLTFPGAAGLVSAGGSHSAAGDDKLFTNGISDYSQAPAQYMLMPFSRQRAVLENQACSPVAPEDVQMVV